MPESAIPAYITSLIRHFEDLRDGTHGGSATRKDKEAHFEKAVQLLAHTTLSFARAVNANDLKAFYVQTAAEFQHDVPFEKFNAGFSPFIEHHINLAPVEKVAPLLTSEPGVSAQGVLQV